MVHAGCVFVAGIHLSRTWTSGSFESVQWNACVHRLDLGLYSHPKEFLGNEVRTHVNSKGKIPFTPKNSPQRRIKPTMLHQAGQRAQHTTNELCRPPVCFWELYWTAWYSTALYCTTLHHTALYCNVLYWAVLTAHSLISAHTDLETFAQQFLDGPLQLMVLRLTDVNVKLWDLCWPSW